MASANCCQRLLISTECLRPSLSNSRTDVRRRSPIKISDSRSCSSFRSIKLPTFIPDAAALLVSPLASADSRAASSPVSLAPVHTSDQFSWPNPSSHSVCVAPEPSSNDSAISRYFFISAFSDWTVSVLRFRPTPRTAAFSSEL